MKDSRVETLAKNLISYSTDLKPGEKVLIEAIGLEHPLVTALIREAYGVRALPFVTIKDPEINRELLMGATEEQQKQTAEYELKRMKDMDAYIGIRLGPIPLN